MAVRTRDSLRLDMSSLDIAASPPIRRDATVQISLLLAFADGYLDAYIWIIHGVMANAQTANMVLLWVHGTVDEWDRAAQFVPPMAAFMVGIVIAAWLRRPGIFAALCIAFGIGAAVGAYATKVIPDLALGLPVVALLIVLLRCELHPNEERL
jgi:uncharacterized membrane protein YoaK (UPF0700 family)